jgi:hypothetical protein
MAKVTKFETNDQGTPILGNDSLYPNSQYERTPRREYVTNRLKDRAHVANWVRNAVIGDLETLDKGIACREDPDKGGGNFLLQVGCMMAFEYFAAIYSETNQSPVARAKAYAKDFMRNPRYKTCIPLLLHARNGIAHGSWPMRVQVDGVQYPFAVGYDYPETCVHLHLSLHKAGDEKAPSEKLFVNPRLMLIDLRESVEREPKGFLRWIVDVADDDVVRRAQPSFVRCDVAELSKWK